MAAHKVTCRTTCEDCKLLLNHYCPNCDADVMRTFKRRGMHRETQRRYRARKKQAGLCQENGCQTPTGDYRCNHCKQLHAMRDAFRAKKRP